MKSLKLEEIDYIREIIRDEYAQIPEINEEK